MKLSLASLIIVGLFAIGLTGCETDPAAQPAEMQKAPQPQDTPKPAAPQSPSQENPPASKGQASQGPVPAGPAAAPAAPAPQQQVALSEKDLLHHRFVLKTADGVDYSTKERVPTLEFNEGFRVSGGICNRFTGQAKLEGSVLTVKQMASTKMLCVDQALNALETTFAVMLDKGVAVTLADNVLTLSGDGHVLVYELRDLVQ